MPRSIRRFIRTMLAACAALLYCSPLAQAQVITLNQGPPPSSPSTSGAVDVTWSGVYGQDASCDHFQCVYYPYDESVVLGTFGLTLDGATRAASMVPNESESCTHDVNNAYRCEQAGHATGTLSYAFGSHVLVASVQEHSGLSMLTASDSFTVMPPPPLTATVTPGAASTQLGGGLTEQSVGFLVRNTTGVASRVLLHAECTPSMATARCEPSLKEMYLQPNEAAPVRVIFNTTGSTGGVYLYAHDPATTAIVDSASTIAEFNPPTAPVVVVPTFQAGPNVERSLCPTVAVVGGVAAQCGATRIVHVLPAVTTYGRTYAPTLAYYTDQIGGTQLQAVVSLPDTRVPDSVVLAVFDVNGAGTRASQALLTKTYAGAAWASHQPQRLVTGNIPTPANAIATYDVQAVAYYTGTPSPSPFVRGLVAAPSRYGNWAGNGWTLLGQEELVPNQVAGLVLWMSGDGSTRGYFPVPAAARGDTAAYGAPGITGPDSLYYLASVKEWRRPLEKGAMVHFDSLGRHIRTVNRFSRTTTFQYEAAPSRRLTGITVPGGPSYAIAYNTNDIAITAPGARVVHLRGRSGANNSFAIDSIVDPDASVEHFGYISWGPDYAIGGRWDARGNPTDLPWAPYAKTLLQATTPVDSTTVVPHFSTAYGRGSPPTAGAEPASTAAYVLDGPRTDVADVDSVWTDSLGAVVRRVNALGQATVVEHGDPRFPGLATRVVRVTGSDSVESRASYDARGRLVASTQINPLGDGRTATTTYAWDDRWDVLRVSRPIGQDSTVQTIDPLTGNVTHVAGPFGGSDYYFRADGLVDSTRVVGARDTYTYDVLGNLSTHVDPLGRQYATLRDALGRVIRSTAPFDSVNVQHDSVVYDAAGRDSLTLTWSYGDTLRVVTLYDPLGHVLRVDQRPSTARVPTVDEDGVAGAPLAIVTRTFAYDALGRKTQELSGDWPVEMPRYDAAGNVLGGTKQTWGLIKIYDALNRPVRDSVVGSAPVATYTYDPAGNLGSAVNAVARIQRTYYPNGQLRTDSTWVTGDVIGAAGGGVSAGLAYTYDLAGRPTSLQYPGAPMPGTATYGYDPRTGQVATITSPSGLVFRYHYDGYGRLDTLVRGSGTSTPIVESRVYDAVSRLASRQVPGYYNEGMEYDAGDRMLNGASYDSFGHAIATNVNGVAETFSFDALGNRLTAHRQSGHGSYGDTKSFYEPVSGRLRMSAASQTTAKDTTLMTYTYQGGLLSSVHHSRVPQYQTNTGGTSTYGTVDVVLQTARTNYYDVTGHMTASAAVWDSLDTGGLPTHAAYYRNQELYRYDALGRRVWTQVARGQQCQQVEPLTNCTNTSTFTLWDGDQILGETITSADAASLPSWVGYAGVATQAVQYVQGISIDEPLEVTKDGQQVVLPIADYRGSLNKGGCPLAKCTTQLVFPSATRGVYGEWQPSNAWFGTLLTAPTDGSGYVYRRNRYLDPSTGQFTQEDPLGLAGGLNVYGYANGDPVTYSDPFGLCPTADGKDDGKPCVNHVVVTYWGAANGNPYGHISTSVNGRVYSHEPAPGASMFGGKGAYIRGTTSASAYAKKEQGRESFSVELRLSDKQASQVEASLARFDGSVYNVATRNCTLPTQEALRSIGIDIQRTIRPDSFIQTLTDNQLIRQVTVP